MSNKFKKIVACIIGVAIVASITLVGCGTEAVASDEYSRFHAEYENFNVCTITDQDTGVQYLLFDNGYGAGLTVLLDPDGTPHCVDEE